LKIFTLKSSHCIVDILNAEITLTSAAMVYTRRLGALIFALALLRGSGFTLSSKAETRTPSRKLGRYDCISRESLGVLASSLSDDDASPTAGDCPDGHVVEVHYEGRRTEVVVQRDESILSALERTGAARRLAISDPPFECRRGNCLTCAGRHAEGSLTSSVRRGEDGLSPYLSKEVRGLGYVLTCSSFVVGDGVKLELGSNSDAWEAVHTKRLESSDTERVGLEVSSASTCD